MSDYQLIPLYGRAVRLRELLNKYELPEDEKLWVQTYINELERKISLLEKRKQGN